jgi:glycogen debranching enzyme
MFWLPDRDYFAMAIDRDEAGNARPVKTFTSVPAELLETRLLDDSPHHVSSVVQMLFSGEFLTDVGIRMRGLSHIDLVPYSDYQGAAVSWAVTSNIFAIGLRRHGLVPLAEEIEDKILQALGRTKQFVEFWYVYREGRVAYKTQKVGSPGSEKAERMVVATNVAENNQAWTISAAIRATLQQAKSYEESPSDHDLIERVVEGLEAPNWASIDTERGIALEEQVFGFNPITQ